MKSIGGGSIIKAYQRRIGIVAWQQRMAS